MRTRIHFVLGVASLVVCVGADAAITYIGSVSTNACGTSKETLGVGLVQSETGGAAPGLSCSSSAQNAVAPGEVRIRATSSVSGAADFGRSDTFAQAYYAVDDLIFTGPGPTASGILKLHVDGLLDAATGIDGNQVSANTSAQWLLKINSSFGAGETRLAQSSVIVNEAGETQTSIISSGSFGALDGYVGGTSVVVLAFADVATNKPMSFFLDVFGQAIAQASGCASDALCKSWNAGSTGELNYMSTVSFVREGATFVFDGSGYAAQSASLGIVDSVWTTPVPEPASLMLLLPGLWAVVRGTRQRRNRGGNHAVTAH